MDFTDYTDGSHAMNAKLKHEDFSHQIIGAAMEVLNELRPGQDERIYERALEVELGLRGMTGMPL